MCRSRRWPKPPSMPIARCSWRCAAAIFAKGSRVLWRSGRRGLRGSEGSRIEPAFAQKGYGEAAFATIGLAQPKQAQPAKAGGARRDRTADLLHAMQALSQLSYGPFRTAARLGRRAGHAES